MSGYRFTPEQLSVARQAASTPLFAKAGPKVKLALAEAGLVESNFKNLSGGDRDSAGYLQQRPSQGWGSYSQVRDPSYATTKFLQSALQLRGKYGKAGDLAQAVQRSAYPERYAEHASEAIALLHDLHLGQAGAFTGGTPPQAQATGTGVDPSAILAALQGSQTPQGPSIGALPRPKELGGQPQAQIPKPVQAQEPPQEGLQQALTALLGSQQPTTQAEAKTAAQGSAGAVGRGPQGAVAFAVKSLGHYAESAGNNLGPELNKLEAKFGMTGEPWCAIFATTAAAQGGASRAARTASVADINRWAAAGSNGYQKGLLSGAQAKPGDLMTFGDAHVAFVKERRGNTVVTIEGNANGSGGVTQRTRSVSEGRIARPRY